MMSKGLSFLEQRECQIPKNMIFAVTWRICYSSFKIKYLEIELKLKMAVDGYNQVPQKFLQVKSHWPTNQQFVVHPSAQFPSMKNTVDFHPFPRNPGKVHPTFCRRFFSKGFKAKSLGFRSCNFDEGFRLG